MKELFPELIKLVIAIPLAYCLWQAHNLRVSPIKVSVYNFISAMFFAFLIMAPVGTLKIIGVAFACQFTLAGAVHLIVNDRNAYKKDAKIWINTMTLLMGITSGLMVVMDYPRTKLIFHGFVIGFVAGALRYIFNIRIDIGDKEGNL